MEEPLAGARLGGVDEGPVALVDIRREQRRALGIGARDQHRRRIANIRGETRGDQLVDRFLGRDQNLAAHVAALLGGGQLILEMHASGTCFDHALHEFEGVQHAAETRFGVGDDRLQPIDRCIPFSMVELIGAQQGGVDALDHFRHRVGRVQGLVGIHLAGEVSVARHLPSREVDRLKPGTHLLHRLVARQCTECVHERHARHVAPKFIRTQPCQRVLDVHRAAQSDDILGGVAATDTAPARVFVPVAGELFGCAKCHGGVLRQRFGGWAFEGRETRGAVRRACGRRARSGTTRSARQR